MSTVAPPRPSSSRATEPDSGSQRRPLWRRRPTFGATVLSTLALLLALVWLVPVLWALATSLKPEAETTSVPPQWFGSQITTTAYRAVVDNSQLLRWFVNSTLTTLAVTAGVLLLCSLAAFGFSRMNFRGRGWLYALVVVGILVPPQVLIIPLFRQLGTLHLIDTYWAIILPQLVAPAIVFILKNFFDAIPSEYEEAAAVDGASPFRIYWNIVVPMSLPVLTAVGIFTFITTWNNFLLPFIVTTDPDLMTLPVGLAAAQGSFQLQYAQVMALALLAGLPLLIVYVLFQRQVIRGVGSAGIKG